MMNPVGKAGSGKPATGGLSLNEIATPALVLDRRILDANLRLMEERAAILGVALRPHMKTAKSIDIAGRLRSVDGICVSTIEEAAYFLGGGFRDICIPGLVAPTKIEGVAQLARQGARITLCVADPRTAGFIVKKASEHGVDFRVLVEIESGAKRTGIDPASPLLIETASIIDGGARTSLAGVMTYAGQAYAARTTDEVKRIAEVERDAVVQAAARLIRASMPCACVSVGSTPTATHATDLSGVTEIRPGNYMFLDVMQVRLGTAAPDRLALSVLTTVVYSDPGRGHVVVDAGALALSKDGAPEPFGYGAVVGLRGEPLAGVPHVVRLFQEHGVLGGVSPALAERMVVGSKLRILPHHACLTAASYDRYYVVDGGATIMDEWTKLTGTYQ
jgi:D-serine deaminase-like pyridoxal phosphate-dependent protein